MPKSTAQQRSLQQRLVRLREQALQDTRTGPHRMEYVCTVKGVEYINDSCSTFFDATLRSLTEVGKRTVWIVGAPGAEVASKVTVPVPAGMIW